MSIESEFKALSPLLLLLAHATDEERDRLSGKHKDKNRKGKRLAKLTLAYAADVRRETETDVMEHEGKCMRRRGMFDPSPCCCATSVFPLCTSKSSLLFSYTSVTITVEILPHPPKPPSDTQIQHLSCFPAACVFLEYILP